MDFHEVRFPAALSFGSSGGPERRTEIVTLTNGYEERNSPWAHSRRRYDAGVGVRSLDDLAEVTAFFEARQGQLYGFRWKDWSDFKSCLPSAAPSALDQEIGTGDGSADELRAGEGATGRGRRATLRPIAKPVAGTVRVAVGGVVLAEGAGFTVDAGVGAGRAGGGAGGGGAGDGGLRVRRAGALRHRPDQREPVGVRGGRDPAGAGDRGAGLMRDDRSRAAGAARRAGDDALPLLAGAAARRGGARLHRPRSRPRVRGDAVPGVERDGHDDAAARDRAERRQRAGDGRAERRLGARGGHPRRAVRRRGDLALAGRLGAAGRCGCCCSAGAFGEIRRSGGAFEVELRGPAEALNAPVGRTIMKSCDRALGDARCGFDVTRPGFSGEGVVLRGRAAPTVVASGLGGFADGWFVHGQADLALGRQRGRERDGEGGPAGR